MHKLKIIYGSTRPTRGGLPVAKWVEAAAREHGGFDVELIELADMNLPLLDEPEMPQMRKYMHDHTKAWSAKIEEADAVVFVTPEYDGFPPAALVNAIQCLVHEWARKPAAIVSYGGASGGMRSAHALRLLLAGVRLVVVGAAPVVNYMRAIDNGVLQPGEQLPAMAKSMFDELKYFTDRLAKAD